MFEGLNDVYGATLSTNSTAIGGMPVATMFAGGETNCADADVETATHAAAMLHNPRRNINAPRQP